MEEPREFRRSDSSRDKSQRRRHKRADPHTSSMDHYPDQVYSEDHDDRQSDPHHGRNYHFTRTESSYRENRKPLSPDLTGRGTRIGGSNHSRHSKRNAQSESARTTNYVNDSLADGPVEYDDDEQYDENYPNPEESVLSGSNVASTYHSQAPRHRHKRDRSYPPNEPSIDSVSDYNAASLADGTPQNLGGSESGFWTPDLNADGPPPSNGRHSSEAPRGFQKLFASFRRFKRNKSSGAPRALTERNAAGPQPECAARVIMLDGEELSFTLDRNDPGHVLLSRVCQAVDVVETDYFGLTYVSNKLGTWFWLDPERKINKQLKSGDQWLFSFQVKFYPPEPTLLQEDITRYQLTLQVRQDIYTGKLPCSWVTQALLGSFMVQAELGDYDEREHGTSIDYLKEFEFVPSPTPQLLQKIAELHKTHTGMKPNQADVKYLETAKRLELYGIDLHPVRDTENVEIYLGVGFHGIVIYRDRLRIGRFAWPKVLRISYKKNIFFLKIRPDNAEPVETIIGFRLLNHHLAERLWKAAVEHHTFFRLKEARSSGSSTSLRSTYGFTGHTFFQYRTMNINRPHPHFDRSLTKRRTASVPLSLNKSPSIHTLNRAHPRDMTVGRSQTIDGGSNRDVASGSRRHTSSTNQLYPPPPHPSSETRYSGSSRSPRYNYNTDSQTHDYVNDGYGPTRDSHDQGSYLSASLVSEPTGRAASHRPSQHPHRISDNNLPSPVYTNVPTSTVPDRYSSSNSNTDNHRRSARTPTNRKPPGGVPVLGGSMLGEGFERPDNKANRRSKDPQHQFYEIAEADFEEPLEYDDDVADAFNGSGGEEISNDTSVSPEGAQTNSHRHRRNNFKPRSSAHSPRRTSDNPELML